MTSVETSWAGAGSREEEQPVETGRPGGEIEGMGEGRERTVHRHPGHSPEAHPNSPAGVTHAEKSIQDGKPSIVRDQQAESERKADRAMVRKGMVLGDMVFQKRWKCGSE